MDKATSISVEKTRGIFAISDGVGSTPHAEVASEKVLTFLKKEMEKEGSFYPRKTTVNIQEKMANFAIASPDYKEMAATLAGLFVEEGQAVVFNTGDSRVYLLRNAQMQQLSKDHTQARRMLESGEVDQDSFDHLSGIYNMLEGYLVAGELEDEDILVNVHKLKVEAGDTYLLCSDGVSDVLTDNEIFEMINSQEDVLRKCENLFQKVYASAIDNISIVLVVID